MNGCFFFLDKTIDREPETPIEDVPCLDAGQVSEAVNTVYVSHSQLYKSSSRLSGELFGCTLVALYVRVLSCNMFASVGF